MSVFRVGLFSVVCEQFCGVFLVGFWTPILGLFVEIGFVFMGIPRALIVCPFPSDRGWFESNKQAVVPKTKRPRVFWCSHREPHVCMPPVTPLLVLICSVGEAAQGGCGGWRVCCWHWHKAGSARSLKGPHSAVPCRLRRHLVLGMAVVQCISTGHAYLLQQQSPTAVHQSLCLIPLAPWRIP